MTPEQWARALSDPAVVSRYRAKLVVTSGCWWWTGALMRSGHARFWVGAENGRDLVVIGHRFGWGLAHGVDALLAVPTIAHACDEALCQRPDVGHAQASTQRANREEWLARRWRLGSPHRDIRGRAGRALAIRDAARSGTSTTAAREIGLSDLDRNQLMLEW